MLTVPWAMLFMALPGLSIWHYTKCEGFASVHAALAGLENWPPQVSTGMSTSDVVSLGADASASCIA